LYSLRKLLWGVIVTTTGALVYAFPAGAVGGYSCSNQWSNSFTGTMHLIVGNLLSLFVVVAVGGGISALAGVVLLHWSRYKAFLLGFLGWIIIAAIGIVVWPGFITSFTNAICG